MRADAVVLGRVLLHYRVRARLSQAALATAIGHPQSMVSRIERGHHVLGLFLFRRLCEALSVSSAVVEDVVGKVTTRLRGVVESFTAMPVTGSWWDEAIRRGGERGATGLVEFVVAAVLYDLNVPAAKRTRKPGQVRGPVPS